MTVRALNAKGRTGGLLWTRRQVERYVDGLLADLQREHARALDARDRELERVTTIANDALRLVADLGGECAQLAINANRFLEPLRAKPEAEVPPEAA